MTQNNKLLCGQHMNSLNNVANNDVYWSYWFFSIDVLVCYICNMIAYMK